MLIKASLDDLLEVIDPRIFIRIGKLLTVFLFFKNGIKMRPEATPQVWDIFFWIVLLNKKFIDGVEVQCTKLRLAD